MIDIQKHKFILVRVLKEIYSDKEIAPILGFKGGTACYLFYNLPRFSVDLDFNLLDKDKKDVVFQKIKKFLMKYGQLKEAREKRYTLFFLLSYGDESTNIKVEISKRKFTENYEVKNYLGIPMLVMEKKDMLAHKLVALLDRSDIANRDLFDLWYFLENNWPINKEIVELRTNKPFKNYLKKCIKSVRKVSERYILQGLGEVLAEERKRWVKENLKKELLFLMEYYLESQRGGQ